MMTLDEKNSKKINEELKSFGYIAKACLGQGAWAHVLKAQDMDTGEFVAVKVIWKRALSDDEWGKIELEFEAMVALEHESIIKLIKMHESYNFVYYILEFCSNGDFLKLVQRRDHIEETEAIIYFRQLIGAMEHAHKRGFCHRDIKLENLFLSKDNVLRVGDWGFARKWRADLSTESCGSLHYAAPEIVTCKPYMGPEVDVWSMGVTLYAIVSGFMPFYGASDAVVIQKIRFACYPVHQSFSPELRDLIKRMLEVDPIKRITIAEIKKHPWFTQNRLVAPLAKEVEAQTALDKAVTALEKNSKDKPVIPSLKIDECKPYVDSAEDSAARSIRHTKRLTPDMRVPEQEPAQQPQQPQQKEGATNNDKAATTKLTMENLTKKSPLPPHMNLALAPVAASPRLVPTSVVTPATPRTPRTLVQVAVQMEKKPSEESVPAEERKKSKTKEKVRFFLKTLLGSGSKDRKEEEKRKAEELKVKRKTMNLRGVALMFEEEEIKRRDRSGSL